MKSASQTFDHRAIESKWRDVWQKNGLDVTDIGRGDKPFYNLMMFPYPSAEGLHVGNMYAFTGSDIYGRFKRMQGHTVFEPIGLDGFGIHSENYALKIGKHPMDQAKTSEKNFYKQLKSIGAMFDWTRALQTYDPDYYQWTQWLFVQMFKHGLAYRGTGEVNWCPSDKTVLADEQVIDGRCERCGNIVEKKLLEQWFFRITAYAGKLLENLPRLDWSEKVKIAQKNWIGKKEGIEITYSVVDESGKSMGELACFTTRPDTNFGATFVVIAPEHPFINQLLRVLKSEKVLVIRRYVESAQKVSKADRIASGRKKTGVFTGFYCVNQLNGYRMPLYVSDFVVMAVGTGAVVGVPGHDTRDFEFAQAMKLPVVRVVQGPDGDETEITSPEQVQEDEGKMIHSEFLNGLDVHKAIAKMMEYLEQKGWGKQVATYHLRDWLISRQRYWGPPIPMIYCENCKKDGKSWFSTSEAPLVANENFDPSSEVARKGGKGHTVKIEAGQNFVGSPELRSSMAGWYPVPEKDLPVLLPRIPDYKPGDDPDVMSGPLANHKEFYHVVCPGCGREARRETDVSDTFLDSSWYFLRYPSVGTGGAYRGEPFDSSRQGPDQLDVHHGSSAKAMTGLEKTRRAAPDQIPWDPEITKKWLPVDMYTGGAEHSVLHLLYSRFVWKALRDWGYLDFSGEAGPRSAWDEPFTRFFAHGLVIKEGAKMSKSKGNVVTPDEYIANYGADSLRLYLMFMGPYDAGGDFRDTAMEGMARWTGRVWRMALNSMDKHSNTSSAKVKKDIERLVKKVGEDIERRHYNTAIASMMEFTNVVSDEKGNLSLVDLKTFIKLLAPFAPYIAEELWFKTTSHEVAKGAEVAHQISRAVRSPSTSSGAASPDISKFDELPAPSFSSVHLQPWPTFDPSAIREETVQIVVQVNGKLRDTLTVQSAKDKVQSEVEKTARASAKVQKFLDGHTVKKVIFVPGRLVNFVL